jgi:hypothetical protein
MCHHGNPQIRAVSDQGRQKRGIENGDTGGPFVRPAKHAGEITPRIDLRQQILHAHAWQRPFDGAAQVLKSGWEFEGIAPFQVELGFQA